MARISEIISVIAWNILDMSHAWQIQMFGCGNQKWMMGHHTGNICYCILMIVCQSPICQGRRCRTWVNILP